MNLYFVLGSHVWSRPRCKLVPRLTECCTPAGHALYFIASSKCDRSDRGGGQNTQHIVSSVNDVAQFRC